MKWTLQALVAAGDMIREGQNTAHILDAALAAQAKTAEGMDALLNQIVLLMMEHEAAERVEMMGVLTNKFCRHCGFATCSGQCENDE